jgi:small GTP-binding protein
MRRVVFRATCASRQSTWALISLRFQSQAGRGQRHPWTEGEIAPDATATQFRKKLNASTMGHYVRAKIQQDRRDIGLAEVVDWEEFCKDAVYIPARGGAMWVGQDDPRCVRLMKRKEKMKEKPAQVARAQPNRDQAKELETHPMREFFSTPSDMNNPLTIADGLLKAGMIKVHDVKHMASQIKWKPRPPIVTIMGHVDHGKTTLLDYLRNTNVAAGEAGGITQSIGAFRVNVTKAMKRINGEEVAPQKPASSTPTAPTPAAQPSPPRGSSSPVMMANRTPQPAKIVLAPAEEPQAPLEEVSDFITFIDTPGHAAFKEMRESGAAATDLVLLIISAVDGIQPQTIESLEIIRQKKVPYIIVFNKIDRQENVKKHLDQLRALNVELEEDGGDVMWIGVSALHGTNVPELLEMIQLQTSLLEVATPDPSRCELLVIDSHSKVKNSIAGIVRCGTLRHGQTIASGALYGVITEMRDESGEHVIRSAEVGQPVLLQGFKVLPKPGVVMFQLANEAFAQKYYALMKDVYAAEGGRENFLQMLNAERLGKIYDRKPDNNETVGFDYTPFNLAVKASSFGQLQAVMRLLYELPPLEGVRLNIKGAEVGGINDYDVLGLMGKQQPGGVLVFGQTQNSNRLELPEFIEVHYCQVVYHGIEWVKEKLVGLMPKILKERVIAEARVKQVFRASQAGRGNAAGLDVVAGTLSATENFIVMRPTRPGQDPIKVYEGRCKELRRFKEQVPTVEQGLECGMILHEDFTFRVGDRIQQVVNDVIVRDVRATIDAAKEEELRQREIHMAAQQGEEFPTTAPLEEEAKPREDSLAA